MKPIDALIPNESLDNPWHVGDAKHFPETVNQKRFGISGYREHHLDGGVNGKLVSYVRNGAREFHHADANSVSGEFVGNGESPNVRFVATMFHAIKKHLDTETTPVRVVGGGKLFDHYRKLGVLLKKRHPEYHIGDVKDYSSPGESDLKSFTVLKTSGQSPMFDANNRIAEMATFENGYEYSPCFYFGPEQ